MRLSPELFENEIADALPQLALQRRQPGKVDAASAQQIPIRPFDELDPVAGLDSEGFDNCGGKCNLALGSEFHEHESDSNTSHLTKCLAGKALLVRVGSMRLHAIRLLHGGDV